MNTVEDYKFLGAHINNKLDWAENTQTLYRKGQSRLYDDAEDVQSEGGRLICKASDVVTERRTLLKLHPEQHLPPPPSRPGPALKHAS